MSKAHKIIELRSPPYAPGARGAQVAPFAAELRPIQPLVRCLVVDVETAARFAIERLDELDSRELFELTGSSTMPDGTPARGIRIGWRRYRAGAGAMQPASFHALLYLEVDTGDMETRLKGIAADGFAEAKEEADRRQRSAVHATPAATLERAAELLGAEAGQATETAAQPEASQPSGEPRHLLRRDS